jgi:hypothetical protein
VVLRDGGGLRIHATRVSLVILKGSQSLSSVKSSQPKNKLTGLNAGSLAFVAGVACSSVLDAG